jgi:hypothetical protein
MIWEVELFPHKKHPKNVRSFEEFVTNYLYSWVRTHSRVYLDYVSREVTHSLLQVFQHELRGVLIFCQIFMGYEPYMHQGYMYVYHLWSTRKLQWVLKWNSAACLCTLYIYLCALTDRISGTVLLCPCYHWSSTGLFPSKKKLVRDYRYWNMDALARVWLTEPRISQKRVGSVWSGPIGIPSSQVIAHAPTI